MQHGLSKLILDEFKRNKPKTVTIANARKRLEHGETVYAIANHGNEFCLVIIDSVADLEKHEKSLFCFFQKVRRS